MSVDRPAIRISADAAASLSATRQLAEQMLPPPSEMPAFVYGRCRSDYKSGAAIRWDRPRDDYVLGQTRGYVEVMLAKLGLPLPNNAEIFRGTRHDLLFIESHGVVVRIGPASIAQLLHPAILQPLGWMEDKSFCFGMQYEHLTVAIYPGVALFDHHLKQLLPKRPEGDLRETLGMTGYGTTDIETKGNTGVIPVESDAGHQQVVRLMIDADASFNGLRNWNAKGPRDEEVAQLFDTVLDAGLDRADAMAIAMRTIFNEVASPWHRAQAAHDGLRRLFWDAVSGPDAGTSAINVTARDRFWQACHAATKGPLALPVNTWQRHVDADGGVTFDCAPTSLPVRLHTPWTGERKDQRGYAANRDPQDFIKAVGYALQYRARQVGRVLLPPTPFSG